MEQWKKIKGYPDYSISDFGNVRSDRFNRLLKASPSSQSYLYVNLTNNKKKKTTAVHKLVIEHFGASVTEANMVVDHLDGNKQNNCIDNLEWITISENTRRAYGNEDKRILVKELRNQGWTMQKIADHVGKSLGFVQGAIHT
jgi:hypothetical protein